MRRRIGQCVEDFLKIACENYIKIKSTSEGPVMNTLRYEVIYLSDAPIATLKNRLAAACEGAWEARRMGLSLLRKGSRQYRLFFERESDIKALLQ